MIDLLCFAKPIHCDGLAMLRKAFSMMEWLCFAKPIHCVGMALLCKTIPLQRIGFASQSQSVAYISTLSRFWPFRFFQGPVFQVFGCHRGLRFNRLWCPPGGPAALLLLPVDDEMILPLPRGGGMYQPSGRGGGGSAQEIVSSDMEVPPGGRPV